MYFKIYIYYIGSGFTIVTVIQKCNISLFSLMNDNNYVGWSVECWVKHLMNVMKDVNFWRMWLGVSFCICEVTFTWSNCLPNYSKTNSM
jgi:hypothetical protein